MPLVHMREVGSLFTKKLLRRASLSEFEPGTLYHYTGATGARGILLDCCLWATNFSFLNDPTEMHHGRKLVSTILGEQEGMGRASTNSLVEAIREHFELAAVSEFYVSCFTELRDDLSQWRAYGAQVQPRYCIGFDLEEIRQLEKGALPDPEVDFVSVTYDEAEQRKEIIRVIEAAFEIAEILPHAVQHVAWWTALFLARLLPQLKAPAFSVEKEWRIIRWIPDNDVSDVCFETARGVVRPYVVFKPLPRVVELVVLAPGREHASVKAAEMLLRKANICDVQPELSRVPFAE